MCLFQAELQVHELTMRDFRKAQRECSIEKLQPLIDGQISKNTDVDFIEYEFMNPSTRGSRYLALLVAVIVLVTPILLLKYMDEIDRLRRRKSVRLSSDHASQRTDEEVPLSKRVAYRVDVLFSQHTFVKPLALLVGTILLIAVGGLAIYGVTGESFDEALWRAWTYIADSGNHADNNGLGPRIVAVFISFGGMLIFALMLGLVSDAISEKVDSLRKGKSEVVERNHILILGWSDKLVTTKIQKCFFEGHQPYVMISVEIHKFLYLCLNSQVK